MDKDSFVYMFVKQCELFSYLNCKGWICKSSEGWICKSSVWFYIQ